MTTNPFIYTNPNYLFPYGLSPVDSAVVSGTRTIPYTHGMPTVAKLLLDGALLLGAAAAADLFKENIKYRNYTISPQYALATASFAVSAFGLYSGAALTAKVAYMFASSLVMSTSDRIARENPIQATLLGAATCIGSLVYLADFIRNTTVVVKEFTQRVPLYALRNGVSYNPYMHPGHVNPWLL